VARDPRQPDQILRDQRSTHPTGYISRTTPSGGVEQNFLGFAFKIFKE
jgi:hypothetical protein